MLANLPAVRVTGRTAPVLTPAVRLIILALLAVAAVAVFMTIDAKGQWDFVLPFRGKKVLAIMLVGYAIAISTVMFQTITDNRILTPSLMGFDALYMLIQTVAVFTLGSGRLLAIEPRWRFGIEVVAMVVFAGLLSWWLFVRSRRSLHLLLLAGIIFGVMFRSVTNFVQRVIEPNEFAMLQDAGFASFNTIDQTLLVVASGLVVAVTVVVMRFVHVLDVLGLGRETAINLGVNYQPTVTVILVLITILVAVSTALVGPVTFFGLLVANLAYLLAGSARHRYTLAAASFIAVITLVAGQTILERVFSFDGSLSIVIDFAGGIMFIALLLRGNAR